MEITDLSNIYNRSNTKQLTEKLNKIKQHLGNVAFQQLLDSLGSGDILDVEKVIHNFDDKYDRPDLRYQSPDARLRYDLLDELLAAARFANSHNSHEEECDNCHEFRADVWKRSNGQHLCSNCAKDIVEEVKPSPALLKAINKGYDIGRDIDYSDLFDNIDYEHDDVDILV